MSVTPQERAELIAAHKTELEALLEKRSVLEQVGGSWAVRCLGCRMWAHLAACFNQLYLAGSIYHLPGVEVQQSLVNCPALCRRDVQEFMEAYLAACEAYENELERLRGEGVAEHAALKRK